jgi:hypothetical protein
MKGGAVMAKRRIRQNRYDNWYGYEGSKRVIAFFNDSQGTQEEHARDWLNEVIEPNPKPLTATVEMGQGFRYSLPEAIKELGGRVWWTRLDSSSTRCLCRVTFTKLTTVDGRLTSSPTVEQLQACLWAKWPACSIGVYR